MNNINVKRYLIVLLLLFFISSVNAQSFYGGLDLGFTISQVDGDNHGGFHKIAPTGGVYVRNDFHKSNWGMSLAVLYKNKGSRANLKDDNGEVIGKYAIDLHYIEVPLMLIYHIEKIGIQNVFNYTFKKDLYIEFGPSLGYLIKGTEYLDNVDYKRLSFKKYEVALNAGLTYCLTQHWFLNFRYSYTFPLVPIHPHPGGQVYWLNRGMYNNNMNFSLIYEF